MPPEPTQLGNPRSPRGDPEPQRPQRTGPEPVLTMPVLAEPAPMAEMRSSARPELLGGPLAHLAGDCRRSEDHAVQSQQSPRGVPRGGWSRIEDAPEEVAVLRVHGPGDEGRASPEASTPVRGCKNRCGRPAAEGYAACCRTCTRSKGCAHGPRCIHLFCEGTVPEEALVYDLPFQRAPRPQRLKRSMCKYWMGDGCIKGDRCRFAHGQHEIGQPVKRGPRAPAKAVSLPPTEKGSSSGSDFPTSEDDAGSNAEGSSTCSSSSGSSDVTDTDPNEKKDQSAPSSPRADLPPIPPLGSGLSLAALLPQLSFGSRRPSELKDFVAEAENDEPVVMRDSRDGSHTSSPPRKDEQDSDSSGPSNVDDKWTFEQRPPLTLRARLRAVSRKAVVETMDFFADWFDPGRFDHEGSAVSSEEGAGTRSSRLRAALRRGGSRETPTTQRGADAGTEEAPVARSKGEAGAQWEWHDSDAARWVPFADKNSCVFEMSFREGRDALDIHNTTSRTQEAKSLYRFDFNDMTQVVCSTGACRRIRRRAHKQALKRLQSPRWRDSPRLDVAVRTPVVTQMRLYRGVSITKKQLQQLHRRSVDRVRGGQEVPDSPTPIAEAVSRLLSLASQREIVALSRLSPQELDAAWGQLEIAPPVPQQRLYRGVPITKLHFQQLHTQCVRKMNSGQEASEGMPPPVGRVLSLQSQREQAALSRLSSQDLDAAWAQLEVVPSDADGEETEPVSPLNLSMDTCPTRSRYSEMSYGPGSETTDVSNFMGLRRIGSASAGVAMWASHTFSEVAKLRTLEDVDAFVSAEVASGFTKKEWQRFPVFVCAQCLVCFLLWLGFAATDYEGAEVGILSARGGLDSLWPAGTTLRIHEDCVDLRLQVHRWVLYQFTHVGLPHIMLNCFMVAFLGAALEGFHGSLRMLLLFNAGVIGGGMWMAVESPHTPSTVGMSGGCYAIFGLTFADLVLNWRVNRYRKVKVPMLLGFAILDALNLQAMNGVSGGTNTVNRSAHVGGFMVGMLTGLAVGRQWTAKGHKRLLRILACTMSLSMIMFSLVWTSQWPPRSIWDPTPWCWARQVQHMAVFGDLEWHCVRCADQECVDTWEGMEKTSAYVGILEVNHVEKCECDGCWDVTGAPDVVAGEAPPL